LATAICAICFNVMPITTIEAEHTCPWARIPQHGDRYRALGVLSQPPCSAAYIIVTFESNFRQGHGPPSQGWRTFLRNHAPDIAAMDVFVVPTIGFDLLYAFIIVRLDRRDLVWINVTTNPTAEWIARQLTEAFPWDEAPRHLIRDRDRIYGALVMGRIRAMGIRDRPTAPASPWQNGFAERLIGSIRRECVDHFIVLGEAHPNALPSAEPRRCRPAPAGRRRASPRAVCSAAMASLHAIQTRSDRNRHVTRVLEYSST
jgi:transposase InsO family protein